MHLPREAGDFVGSSALAAALRALENFSGVDANSGTRPFEHLQLPDVRLVAQSMGGWTCLEYVLKDPRKVRALVLTSTCGSIDRASVPLADPNRLNEWDRMADAARADMARRGISPPAGERMAKEQPSLHYLYREIANASAAFD